MAKIHDGMKSLGQAVLGLLGLVLLVAVPYGCDKLLGTSSVISADKITHASGVSYWAVRDTSLAESLASEGKGYQPPGKRYRYAYEFKGEGITPEEGERVMLAWDIDHRPKADLKPDQRALLAYTEALSKADRDKFGEGLWSLWDQYKMEFMDRYTGSGHMKDGVYVHDVPSHASLLAYIAPCFRNWEGVRDWPDDVKEAVRAEFGRAYPFLVRAWDGDEVTKARARRQLEAMGFR